ncbi:MAG: hypothetical protein Q8891_07990 [Bacteroidota bacterium]|nr:hypothetical protein [Bacteroidota bacterium]
MDILLERSKSIDFAVKQAKNKARLCLFPNCSNAAIKSHVFQRNGILNQIASKGHVYKVEPTNIFERSKKGSLLFKRTGINDVFTFPGYCKDHDNSVFKKLESGNPDFYAVQNQFLLGYRCICQEIRIKEISYDCLSGVDVTHFHPASISQFKLSAAGYLKGIENLLIFKKILEEGIINSDYSHYSFVTLKIPRVELCISAPLTISYDRLIHIPRELQLKKLLEVPIETTMFNTFPVKDYSYVIIGFCKNFENKWANEMKALFENSSTKTILKALSDLVSARCEFWCMSEKLFLSILKKIREEYKVFFMQNVLDHNKDLLVNFNLFQDLR